MLTCFNDADSRLRYYACEALYNIVKVARGSVLPHFNVLFDGLSKVRSFLEPPRGFISSTGDAGVFFCSLFSGVRKRGCQSCCRRGGSAARCLFGGLAGSKPHLHVCVGSLSLQTWFLVPLESMAAGTRGGDGCLVTPSESVWRICWSLMRSQRERDLSLTIPITPQESSSPVSALGAPLQRQEKTWDLLVQ